MAASRKVRSPRIAKVGESEYFIGKKATRKVSRPDGAGTRQIQIKKKSGDTITHSLAKSDDAKNTRIGRYARKHATVNADGSTTYAKKGGGTVTRTTSVSSGAKVATARQKRKY